MVLVCSLGYMNDRKLSAELLDAWCLRDKRVPSRLVLVGETEARYGEVLRSKIALSENPSEIRITGYVSEEDFQQYVQAADVIVQLRKGSRGEASRAALYAMAHGVPLVASRHGSFAEIPDDACVHVDDPLDITQLAAIVSDLVDNADKRAMIG